MSLVLQGDFNVLEDDPPNRILLDVKGLFTEKGC